MKYPLSADDTEATIRAVQALGAGVKRQKESWFITGGELNPPTEALDCGESGTTLRLMTAVCALLNAEIILKGGPSLSGRPVEPLLDALRQLDIFCQSHGGNPPVKVHGKGGFDGSEVTIKGDISSQFVSALLLIAPFAREQLRVKVTTRLESAPYVGMTLDSMEAFGAHAEVSKGYREITVRRQVYTPTTFAVEGDWSSGAYMLAAGALAGRVSVENLRQGSRQPDSTITKILGEMGAELQFHEHEITIKCAELKGIDWDLTDSPDLFPIVAVLCSVARGKSKLEGLRRLRFKESDRITSMMEGLNRMGVKTETSDEAVTINGGSPQGAAINPYNDHRIAMSFGVLGLVAGGETTIKNAECVSKSYPDFWDDLKVLGARIGR